MKAYANPHSLRATRHRYEVSSHWPTLEGLREAGALVLMIAGVIAVFWALAS